MTAEILTFVEELKTRSDVIGVILFGSWARRDNRPDSDVDLVVILTDSYRRTVEYRKGRVFEIIYTTQKGAFDYWQNHRDDAFGLWEVALILFDRDGTIEKLAGDIKAILAAGKPPI